MRELHELLRHYAGSEQRYKDFVQSMRNSTLTAFYTPPAIVRALAEALRDAGVVPRRLLDPSAGAGIFPSSFRETADGEVEILSFEKDLLTGQVLSALAREREQVVIDGFQTIESAYDSYFDVVTSNIPFGDTRIFDASFRKSDDPVRRQALKAVHNYFFIKGLDTLREGGILAFVTSAALAGMAGALFGLNFSSIAPDKFKFDTSILVLVFVVLGGIGNIRGSVIAAALLTVLPEVLREFGDYRMLIYAIVLIAVMLLGNAPVVRQVFERIRPAKKEVVKEGDAA